MNAHLYTGEVCTWCGMLLYIDDSRHGSSCSECRREMESDANKLAMCERARAGVVLAPSSMPLRVADDAIQSDDASLFLPVADLGVLPISDHANTPTTDRNGVVLEMIGTVAFVVALAAFALLVGKL